MKKILFTLFCILNINFVNAATEMSDVYLLSQTKNTTELQNIENIDIVDKDGNTALCSAIKDGNIESYNLLKNAGANTNHKCIKNIPTEQYEHFITKVASANNSWSFLGLGKWAWTAIGAGVAGGAVAAGMGGGGGSGGNSADESSEETPIPLLNCVHGTQNGTQCNCNTGYIGVLCDILDSVNYIEQYGIIYPKLNCVHGNQNTDVCSCQEGWTGTLCNTEVVCPYQTTSCTGMYQETGRKCQSGETTYVECESVQCGANAHHNGVQCVCETGYEDWQSGIGCSLIPLNCGANANQVGKQCQCNPGYTNWSEGVGCIKKLNCTEYQYQDGDTCVCKPEYLIKGQCGLPFAFYRFTTFLHGGSTGGTDDDDIGTIARDNSDTLIYLLKDATPTGEYAKGIAATNGTSAIWYNAKTADAAIYIKNYTREKAYGFWNEYINGTKSFYNANSDTDGDTVTGHILIENHNKAAYGILGVSGEGNYINAGSCCSGNGTGIGIIYINNEYNGLPNRVVGIQWGTNVKYGDNERLRSGYCTQSNSSDTNIMNAYGYIIINNTYSHPDADAYGKIIGMNHGSNVYIDLNNATSGSAKGYIDITNNDKGVVYGIYNEINNVGGGLYYPTINNVFVYGNMDSINVLGKINITNFGTGNTYGLYSVYNGSYKATNSNSFKNNVQPNAIININNYGVGNAYGIYSDTAINTNGGTGSISIKNYNNANAYGMYSDYNVKNATENTNDNVTNYSAVGLINLTNYSEGKIFGMYGKNVFNEAIETEDYVVNSTINLQNLSSGTSVGIYTKTSGTTNNSGTININNIDNGDVIGIFGEQNAIINNSGTINITRESYVDDDNNLYYPTNVSGKVFGIYGKSGSKINNTGNIIISTNGDAYGIYLEPDNSYGKGFVINSGIISLNGVTCSGTNCKNTNNNAIVLNGSTLYNNGAIQANTLNLAPMKGKVVARAGSSFVVDNDISGDLHIGSDIVTGGNQTTYVAENMIDAGDTSGLNLISDSAMFEASLVGNDVVMQMKEFDTLTDNKSLAAFLKHNYENANGDDLFATLKSMDNMSAFNGALMGVSGLDSFTQFAHEDLSALREISLSMNNKLFENSGRDNFDISDSMGYFSFSDNHNSGSGQYGISSSKMSDNWKLGYGMAMANIYTNDGDGFSRQNQMWMFYMPATYTNDDIELVITSQAGFTRGQYNRRGFNNQNYEGYIEKQIVGLMNDLRYPIIFGNWTFAPDLAFNAIMYNQSGHEDEHEFGLIIPNERMISVETGLGLYSKYEKAFQNGGRLKFTSGVMGYREYGDTYNIKLGMRGMDGTFDLYNNDYKYRAALNMGIDYAVGNFHMYGNTQYFMDNANYMNFKGGISYRF